MNSIRLDARHCKTPEELHAALAQALELGEDYGANLDALYDRLTEPADDLLLRVLLCIDEGWPLRDYGERLARVLADATDANPNLYALTEWVASDC